MAADFELARDFVYRNARLLERRLFGTLFEGAPASGVIAALRGYQNEDGGFGHGLEPDKRAPHSQPLDVRFAFEFLEFARVADEAMVRRACDFLGAVSRADGAVPVFLPSIFSYPRTGYLDDFDPTPGLAPAAGIAGYLHRFGVEHPWREAATRFCFDELERHVPDEAHVIRDALIFLEHVPDRERAEALIPRVAAALPGSRFFVADAGDRAYGQTPLAYAPAPSSRWRAMFSNEQIEQHLARMESDQEGDGGWPLTWEPPGPGPTLEWRGFETVRSLSVLAAYGRLGR